MCPQHHQPRSQCEPWDRHGHTMRFREDLWAAAENVAGDADSDVTTLLTQLLEAVALDGARCYRCKLDAPPVPLEYGDLQGRPLREWLAEAAEEVIRQHPRHEPVRIGAEPGPAPSSPLSSGTAMFREPGQ
jgi:hypothetical protein